MPPPSVLNEYALSPIKKLITGKPTAAVAAQTQRESSATTLDTLAKQLAAKGTPGGKKLATLEANAKGANTDAATGIQPTPSFPTEAAARAAGHKSGDRVIIAGVTGTLD